MRIKIIFFNPVTITKRTVKIIFQWDVSNHCWDVTIENIFGTSCRKYFGRPEDFIENYKRYDIRKNEYISVKSFA